MSFMDNLISAVAAPAITLGHVVKCVEQGDAWGSRDMTISVHGGDGALASALRRGGVDIRSYFHADDSMCVVIDKNDLAKFNQVMSEYGFSQ